MQEAQALYGTNNVAMSDHTDSIGNVTLFAWRNQETGFAFREEDD